MAKEAQVIEKERTLFKELDHLYQEAKHAKRLLTRYQAGEGDITALKERLRGILEYDIDELEVLTQSMAQLEHKTSLEERAIIENILGFLKLLFTHTKEALVDLDQDQLRRVDWALTRVCEDIERIERIERSGLQRITAEAHARYVRILASLAHVRHDLQQLKREAKAIYEQSARLRFKNHTYPLVRTFKQVLNVQLQEGDDLHPYLYTIYCYIDYLSSQLEDAMSRLHDKLDLKHREEGRTTAQIIMISKGGLTDLLRIIQQFIDYFEVKHHDQLVKLLRITLRKTQAIIKRLYTTVEEHSIESNAYANLHGIQRYLDSEEHRMERYHHLRSWMISKGRLNSGRIIPLVLD